jgi:hypothetical protein
MKQFHAAHKVAYFRSMKNEKWGRGPEWHKNLPAERPGLGGFYRLVRIF